MATQNAINTGKPIEIAAGGTGAATLTSNGVLIGNGTSAITALAAGATGQLLIGATSAAPAFGSSAASDFTFTSSTAGSERFVRALHSDNTNTASNAQLQATVGGTSGGDPMAQFVIPGGATWTLGVDNSDSGAMKISASAALGTTDTMIIRTTGEITKPLQPAFLAYLNTQDDNKTGAGTAYTLGSGNALTEVFDQNSDFNTNGTFTAPVTGKYYFSSTVRVGQLTSAMTTGAISLVTTARTYTGSYVNPYAAAYGATDYSFSISVFADMTAGDTATVSVVVSNGAGDTADIYAGGIWTYFSGYLVC